MIWGLKKADKYFVPVLRLMLKAKFLPSSVGLQAPVTLKRRLGRSEGLQNSLGLGVCLSFSDRHGWRLRTDFCNELRKCLG